jgi:hypothetical protein
MLTTRPYSTVASSKGCRTLQLQPKRFGWRLISFGVLVLASGDLLLSVRNIRNTGGPRVIPYHITVTRVDSADVTENYLIVCLCGLCAGVLWLRQFCLPAECI